ncbi:MAG TPA: 50S ribosomal protein L9 [Gemmatimonadota bacterium]|nr:50S ribosomal protein L9 [Gemmatimonadota bacterium]
MAKNTQVILRAEVEDLGHAGDVVDVAPGYARNYLLPRGLAYVANEVNVHRVAQEKRKYQEKLQHEKVQAEEKAVTLAGVELAFRMMAAEEGQLYGSVSAADIADRLAGAGFEVGRQQIKLDPPIKALGEYEVPIRLHPEVIARIQVRIERETA